MFQQITDSSIRLARNHTTLLLIILATITFIPFLGETLFNTKGEPREGVVALAMLDSGNWILPSAAGDIPYKPPMLAWFIAIFSWLFNGGIVNEFTSRLPSALAMIAMVMTGYFVVTKWVNRSTAFIMALLTMTFFEVHRAATNCRVDMVLTMFMVCALYRLYHIYRSGKFKTHILIFSTDIPAILLLGGAILTKGPVGVILPCGIFFLFLLGEHENFVKSSLSVASIAILSLILPVVWYIAAYRIGGDSFLDLVMEENFGRMTGSMSYESHVNPWWYNLITLSSGLLPYTLLLIFTLFSLNFRKLPEKLRNPFRKFMNLSSFDKFSWILIIIVFIFYCIPKSKRSVYLLPMYPLIGFLIAQLIRKIWNSKTLIIKIFSSIIAFLALIVPVVWIIIRILKPIFGSRSTRLALEGLASRSLDLGAVTTISIAFVAGIITLWAIFRTDGKKSILCGLITTLTLYWSFSAFYQPAVLNPKSDYPISEFIKSLPMEQQPRYSWIKEPMLRFYTINFYLNDRIRPLESPKSDEINQIFLIGNRDYEEFKENFSTNFNIETIHEFSKRSCDMGQDILIIKVSPC